MDHPALDFSRKEKKTIILAVTLGNLLEWYEIYLYVYWAPIIAKLFFHSDDLSNLTHTFLIFAVGFLARPLGGLFFGRLGDLIGRRKALILSVMMMIFPTFVTGFLPTYAQIGMMAPIILGFMRIFQSFPAGGELPGAFCYLYESSPIRTRRFMCSWAALGYQLGILISTVECFLLEKYLSTEALIQWGWRLSFLIGGLIGFFGLYLRKRLHETPLYLEMETHEHVVKTPILHVLNYYKKGIFLGILFCALNSSAFYLISVNFPFYFSQALGMDYSNNLLIIVFILIFITIPLPFFGFLGDKFNNKKMLIGSTLGIVLLLFPFYFAITQSSLLLMILTIIPFCLFFTLLSALIPFIIADLFPTNVRFTCVAVSFNLSDAIIGGFTPAAALYLFRFTGNQASFCWILFFTSLLSLISYLVMKERNHTPVHPK
ncbi:MAG TPA: MFS transporter [Chlamydiales bacterium]|nr:MFS transporter [Chlamydiales bacterium]